MTPAAAAVPSRLPGLDGLRALAVLLVVFYHLNLLGVGWVGVQLFFVLSGFLITRILLEQRGAPRPTALKNFYGRRALRIFPAYYLYLLAAGLLVWLLLPTQRAAVGAQWPYAATYLYNWLGMTRFHEKTYFLDHLWSLAVEEQFYLLWPLLVLWLSPTRLKWVLLGLLLAGPALRLGVYVLWPRLAIADPGALPYAVAVCTLSQLDAFAAGGLLCFLNARAAALPSCPRRRASSFHSTALRAAWIPAFAGMTRLLATGLKRPGLWLALGAVLVYLLGAASAGWDVSPRQALGAPLTLGYANTLPLHLQFVWGYSALNLFCAALIAAVAFGGFGEKFFGWRPLAALGRISYGVYLLHFPLAHLMSPLVYRVHDLTGANLYLCILLWSPLYFAVLLALAGASYAYYERRLLMLKDRWFPA